MAPSLVLFHAVNLPGACTFACAIFVFHLSTDECDLSEARLALLLSTARRNVYYFATCIVHLSFPLCIGRGRTDISGVATYVQHLDE